MNIDISKFKRKYGKGPAGEHPLFRPSDAEMQISDPQWHFEILGGREPQTFLLPGSTPYGQAVSYVKEYIARTLSIQNPRVELVA